MSDAKWYGVDGDRVIGPFTLLRYVKEGFHIDSSTHNDEKMDFNLYRYGRKFIGTAEALDKANIRKLPESLTPRSTTHIAIVRGIEINDTIRTQSTGPWMAV